ncbi:hypothetical protein D1157_19005 [Anaerotruncus sp. X29]|nr:hypothetical protein [Anaerotruncus sp. X29]
MLNNDDFNNSLRHNLIFGEETVMPKTKQFEIREGYMQKMEHIRELLEGYGQFEDFACKVKNPNRVTYDEFWSILTLQDLKMFLIDNISAEMILMLHGLYVSTYSTATLKNVFGDSDFRTRVVANEPDLKMRVRLLNSANMLVDSTDETRVYPEPSDRERFHLMSEGEFVPEIGLTYQSQMDHAAMDLSKRLTVFGKDSVNVSYDERIRKELMDLRHAIETLRELGDLNRIKPIVRHATALNPELQHLFASASSHVLLEEIEDEQLVAELLYGIETQLRNHTNTNLAEPPMEHQLWADGYDSGFRDAMAAIEVRMSGKLTDDQLKLIHDVIGTQSDADVVEDNSILVEGSDALTITLDNEIL